MKTQIRLGSAVVAVLAASLMAGLGAHSATQVERTALRKAFDQGNFKDAYEGYRKLAIDPRADRLKVGEDLQMGTASLQRLGRSDEIDEFREAVIKVHAENWRLLQAAAQNYLNVEHHGMIVAGQFERGNQRGNRGGQWVNAYARDRSRAMQLMADALPLVREDADKPAVASFYLTFSHVLMGGSGYNESWRLQVLSDIGQLPDYEEGYYYGGRTQGAPIGDDGLPVYHHVPKTWGDSKSDGERWRWTLAQAVENNPGLLNTVRWELASFFRQQFGEQTMAQYGWFFGRGLDDDAGSEKKEEGDQEKSGTWALNTLGEDETIAKLATGIKRFKLPDEFNYIKILQQIADDAKTGYGDQALNTLAEVFENRRQYEKAASYWRRSIKEHGPGPNNFKDQRLNQIVANWGQFESGPTQPAGQGATVEFRFRNGKQVSFEARAVKVEKLLDDVKAYLKSVSKEVDWQKVNIGDIGYRLVTQGQEQYVGEKVADWSLDLDPRPHHFDRRITVTTPLQKAGAYLVTAKMADGNTSRVVLWVADTVIARKPLAGKMLYYVADAVSGEPIPKANLEFFTWRGRNFAKNDFRVHTRNFAEFSGPDGLVEVDHFKSLVADAELKQNFNQYEWQWLITARKDGRFAFMGFNNVWTAAYHDAEYNQTKVFAITDRPVYRPKQTVKFKLWVRHAKYDQTDTSSYAGQSFPVEIRNPKGEKILTKTIKADDYGGFDSELELPADATLGVYQLAINDPGKRVHGGGSFRVEEYKKPEFEVTVDAPTEPVMLGEKIAATIKAKYYFGSPVTHAKVKYKVMRSSHSDSWYPPGDWDWLYGPGYWWFGHDYHWYPGWSKWGCRRPIPWWWRGGHQPPEVVAEQEVEIGEDGTVKVEIDTSVAKAIHGDLDHQYSITAEVVDQSRRTIVGTGNVTVARKPFKVFSWTHRGYYRTGDVIRASVAARTLDSKPVTGSGKLELFKISYEPRRGDDGKPVLGADGKPILTPVETSVEKWDLDPNAEGRAEQQIKAAAPGQYRLSYRVTDAAEHTIEGGYLFTVVGQGFDGGAFRFNDIELVPDAREYRPEEKLRLQINTNRVGSTVLLFVRPTNGVYLPPKLIKLKGKSTVEEIDVVMKDMPNFFVEAMTVSGGKLYSETKEIVVPPEKRVLNVAAEPSRESYKPGQKAGVKLKVTDHAGKPFVGSTVVAIYDKSVEYISGGTNVPEIRKFFWEWRRHHQPRNESSLDRYFHNLLKQGEIAMANLGVFGHLVADEMEAEDEAKDGGLRTQTATRGRADSLGRESLRKGGFGGAPGAPMAGAEGAAAAPMESKSEAFFAGDKLQQAGQPGAAMVEPTVRKNFADTALWVAALSTREDGTADVSLDMPESLTTWKVRVWGMGHGTKVGQGDAEVVTKKDLIVRMQAPRFFVQKDEVVLSANVHNYLKNKKSVKVMLEVESAAEAHAKAQRRKGEKQEEGDSGSGFRSSDSDLSTSNSELCAFAPLRETSSSPNRELITIVGDSSRTIEIDAGGEARVDFRVRVLDEGNAVVRMKALSDEDSDAMEMRFPVYVHGMLKTESWAGAIRPQQDGGQFTVRVPGERRPEQTRLEIRYSPTLAAAMVDALPYLADYPYGCTEQTLNRFLPTVLTQKVLMNMGLDLKAIGEKRTNLNAQEIGDDRDRAKQWKRFDRNPVFDEAEVRDMVKAGVNRLTEMQLSDGGWGWFSGWGEHSWPHTTAVVVHGLQIATQNDVALVPGVLDRGVAWLKNYQAEQIRRLKNWRDGKPIDPKQPAKQFADNLDAFVYMVLVDADDKDSEMRDFLYRDRVQLAVYAKAMFGLALEKQGAAERDKLDMILQNISQFVVQDDENQTAYLKLPENNYWWYWYGSEVEANGYYLKLLARTDPKGETTARLVKYLLNNRKHATYWNSTRDTAVAIEAFADFLKASGEDKPDLTIEIWIDGKRQKEVAIKADNLFTFDNKLVLAGDAVETGEHTIEFKKRGRGPLYWNGYLTNFTLEDHITRAGLEVKVNRKYFKLVPVNKQVDVAGSRGQAVKQRVEKYERQELPNLATLKSGDLVEIELEIDSKNDYEYLMFEDMKAAGFEPVDLRSGYSGNPLGAYMELRDERVSFFVRALPRGKHSVAYRLRAEIPGRFAALPTRASAMYAPELRGNSDEIKLRIED
jgi:uncharacterized protein YfaS (alpha-2-macroglobulin family)